MWKELPQENQDVLWDWEKNPILEGTLTFMQELSNKNTGKPCYRYEVDWDGGDIAAFFDNFALKTIYKHCQIGDRIKIQVLTVTPSRDGRFNNYTFTVERDEPEEVPAPQTQREEWKGLKGTHSADRTAAERGEVAARYPAKKPISNKDYEDKKVERDEPGIDVSDIPF